MVALLEVLLLHARVVRVEAGLLGRARVDLVLLGAVGRGLLLIGGLGRRVLLLAGSFEVLLLLLQVVAALFVQLVVEFVGSGYCTDSGRGGRGIDAVVLLLSAPAFLLLLAFGLRICLGLFLLAALDPVVHIIAVDVVRILVVLGDLVTQLGRVITVVVVGVPVQLGLLLADAFLGRVRLQLKALSLHLQVAVPLLQGLRLPQLRVGLALQVPGAVARVHVLRRLVDTAVPVALGVPAFDHHSTTLLVGEHLPDALLGSSHPLPELAGVAGEHLEVVFGAFFLSHQATSLA